MDYTVTTTVFCTFDTVGFHFWPDAPHEVRYLSQPHRHKFGFRVEIAVVENDREIEFHTLLRDIYDGWLDGEQSQAYSGDEIGWGARSCEMIATELLTWLRARYPGRPLYRVTVDEDGENGSTVEAVADEIGGRLDSHLVAHSQSGHGFADR